MDMLVRLYSLTEDPAGSGGPEGFEIRRGMPWEKRQVIGWIEATFGPGWAGECERAFSRLPVSCFVAVREGSIAGFSAYECTGRGFFGPAGVEEASRGRGMGTALLLSCLRAMLAEGYAYAIIGGVDESCRPFYARAAGAVPIEGSTPGIYGRKLRVPGRESRDG